MDNLKKITKYVFDVGANDGTDGLAIALKNRNYFVHAFEANPYLIRKIKKLKKKIEKRKGIKLNNYKIHNFAISDKNKKGYFYISVNDKVSSLNEISKKLNITWPGYKDTIFKTVKKIKVKIINLNYFIKINGIKVIRYMHIYTQGSDLKVLKGLKSKLNIVQEGKMEAAVNKLKAAYINNHTIKDVKIFFNKSNFKILKIKKIDHISNKKILNNEADIFFTNKNFIIKDKINLKYNPRYYVRLINDNTYFKDDIMDLFEKFMNLMLQKF